MEVRHDSRSNDAAQAQLVHAAIVELWIGLGEPPVNAKLLKKIQKHLIATFGNHETAGPATIARVLADAGADLKHPEIIETDAEWRNARIEMEAHESGLQLIAEIMTLTSAEAFILKLEELRLRDDHDSRHDSLIQIRNLAAESRRLAESIAKNRSAAHNVRVEQAEIAEWLKLWLQTPALFTEWLELRKRSDEFRARFRR